MLPVLDARWRHHQSFRQQVAGPMLLMVGSLVLFQSCDVDVPSSDITESPPSATTPNFDFIGPEMADLQQLLVSMVTGKGIEIAFDIPTGTV